MTFGNLLKLTNIYFHFHMKTQAISHVRLQLPIYYSLTKTAFQRQEWHVCSLLLIRPGPKGSNYIRSGTHQCRVSIIRMFKVDNVHSKVLLDACKICLPCPFQQRVTLVLNWVQTEQDVPDDNNWVQTKQDAPDDNNCYLLLSCYHLVHPILFVLS